MAAAGGPRPGLGLRSCAEYEAEQCQFPGIPESVQKSVSLEAGMLQPLYTEQFYPSPAAEAVVQQLLPIPKAAPLPEAPDPKTCSPQEYLEYYIFPVLLPGMIELLHEAKKEKCFERKMTKFIACDFLTEWLYNPRQPLPLSVFLSEEEASIIIQSFWRGYLVRSDREVQELRQWQKQLRSEKIIFQKVEEFWAKQEAKVTSYWDSLPSATHVQLPQSTLRTVCK
ncbi:IQ domain-containing protein K isoform X3 [Cyrtonyx montezumae]|uniref:IQ domain-containing protein K isoform X3 n=1 Tax=Cyrtonyx montezumae TaxID=9017 RepID=UPI0032DAC20A